MAARIGELLVARGVVDAERVTRVLSEGARGDPLCSRLLADGVEEGSLVAVLAEKHGLPGLDLSRTALRLDAIDLVPAAVARTDLILPLSLDGGRLHLALARPLEERVVSEVRFVTGFEVSCYIALHASLERAIAGAYEARAAGGTLWRGSAAPEVPHLALAGPGAPGPDALAPADDELIVEADLVVDDAEEEVAIEVEEPPVPDAAPAREGPPLVLVVDDEPEIRQLVERMLLAKGYRVETAQDGADALEKADALLPDLVLLDAMLPKVHGFEACRRLKSSPRTRRVPVVMMTAIYRGWRFAQDARETYGAEDYIEKPFRLDDLLRRVRSAIDASAARALPDAAAAEPNLARGRELLAAGKLPEAAEALALAVRADPYSADAHFQHGRALRARGDAFGAMTALERAVELRQGHLAALRALATIYEEKGFRRKAAETLERAMPAAPNDAARTAIRDDLLRLLA